MPGFEKELGHSQSQVNVSNLRPDMAEFVCYYEKHIAPSLVAGAGIEPTSPSAEPGVLPLHHPAIFMLRATEQAT